MSRWAACVLEQRHHGYWFAMVSHSFGRARTPNAIAYSYACDFHMHTWAERNRQPTHGATMNRGSFVLSSGPTTIYWNKTKAKCPRTAQKSKVVTTLSGERGTHSTSGVCVRLLKPNTFKTFSIQTGSARITYTVPAMCRALCAGCL